MHYAGMAAVILPAREVWDHAYVAASLVIGIVLSALSLHVAMRRGTHHYAIAAGLFALAILGMHFTAMSAVTFIPDGSRELAHHVMDPFALAIIVAASGAFILGQGLIVALVLGALCLPRSLALMVVGPWLGHASWHADRGTLAWLPADAEPAAISQP